MNLLSLETFSKEIRKKAEYPSFLNNLDVSKRNDGLFDPILTSKGKELCEFAEWKKDNPYTLVEASGFNSWEDYEIYKYSSYELGIKSEATTESKIYAEKVNSDICNTANEIEYEKDDNGNIYKTDGELNPNTEYTVNGITYKTDSQGRIVSWEGEPGYNPEAERDGEAQTDAGGEDRQDGDDGGHLVARVLDGSPGNENIVPMRDTVNRGDYKKSENEIAKAKQEGKDVQDSGNIIYEGDSSRPSKIERTYTIDGEKRELKVDNIEGSQDILEDVKDDISEDDYESLEERIEDMEADGSEVSVTSVYKKYDSEGNLASVTVGLRDETNGTKTYITYDAK